MVFLIFCQNSIKDCHDLYNVGAYINKKYDVDVDVDVVDVLMEGGVWIIRGQFI